MTARTITGPDGQTVTVHEDRGESPPMLTVTLGVSHRRHQDRYRAGRSDTATVERWVHRLADRAGQEIASGIAIEVGEAGDDWIRYRSRIRARAAIRPAGY